MERFKRILRSCNGADKREHEGKTGFSQKKRRHPLDIVDYSAAFADDLRQGRKAAVHQNKAGGAPVPPWPLKTFKYKPAGYITANSVNIRNGPGTEYEVIKKANAHTVVTMLAESGDWYYISADNEEGFVSRAFVTVGAIATPEPKPRYGKEEIHMAAQMIWLEAKGGTYEEFQAIATVLANRIASPGYPNTVEANIFAPGQFSVADDREWFSMQKPGSAAMRAASSVLNEGERVLDEPVLYFQTKSLGTEWENRTYFRTIGNHCFFS